MVERSKNAGVVLTIYASSNDNRKSDSSFNYHQELLITFVVGLNSSTKQFFFFFSYHCIVVIIYSDSSHRDCRECCVHAVSDGEKPAYLFVRRLKREYLRLIKACPFQTFKFFRVITLFFTDFFSCVSQKY